MSVRRVVLSSFVLIALARATCAVADDSSGRAVLGPAEPIGELLVLKVGFDDEPQPLPPAPIPLLDPKPFSIPPGLLLTPADTTAPDGYGTPGNGVMRAARITPSDEITFYLSQAVLRLTAAGLTEEAEQASSLLKKFQAKHQPRLLLAAKQAQLEALQTEIERLKLRVEKGITAEQVSVSIMIIEVDDGDARTLFTDNRRIALNGEFQQQSAPPKTFDKRALQNLKSHMQDAKGVRILSSPTLIVKSGQTGEVQSGGKFPTPEVALVGGPKEITFCTTVTATPTITDKDQVRLSMTIETSALDDGNGVTLNGTFVPGVSRRVVRSTLDLKDGQTTIIGGVVSTKGEQTTETFIAVTAEIVPPPYETGAALALPIDDSLPTPTPPQAIKELTAEVESSQEEKQIVIQTTFVSMATDRLKEFLDIPRHDEEELRGNGLSLVYSTIGSTPDFKRKIKVGQKDGTITIHGAPQLLVSSGEPANMIIGGQINSAVVGADGISKPRLLTYGTSLRGTAAIVEGGRVRLRLFAENSSARHRKNDEPEIIGHQAAINVELSPGQTIALGGDSDAARANQWLVLLNAEIVEASDRPVKPSIKTTTVTPAGIIESESVPTP